jgi:hypothetical protein
MEVIENKEEFQRSSMEVQIVPKLTIDEKGIEPQLQNIPSSPAIIKNQKNLSTYFEPVNIEQLEGEVRCCYRISNGCFCDRLLLSFLIQVAIALLVILFCFFKLIEGHLSCGEDTTYIAILTSVVAYFLPAPRPN